MDNTPLFSIIIPVYKVEKYLEECVNSILNQTFTDYEIILVDDDSPDNCPELCDKFAECNKNIKVIHKKNGGLSSARNEGLVHAIGKYIIFIDSDDYYSNKNMLSIVSKAAIEDEDRLLVWRYYRCDENEVFIDNNIQVRMTEYRLSKDNAMLFRKGILFASAWCVAIPKKWYDDSLVFENGVTSEDIVWYYNVLKKTDKIVLFDSPFYVYRKRNGSITGCFTERSLECIKKHINDLINDENKENNLAYNIYIAEQIANYLIVLSRFDKYKTVLTDNSLLNKLKYAVSTRSKIIYLLSCIIGIKNTVGLIKFLDIKRISHEY